MTLKVLRYKIRWESKVTISEMRLGKVLSIIYLPGADNPVMNRLSCQSHNSLQSDCLSVLIGSLYKQETQSSHLSRSVVLNTFSVKNPFEGWEPFAYHLRELTETLQVQSMEFLGAFGYKHKGKGPLEWPPLRQGNVNKDEEFSSFTTLQRVKQNHTK